MTWNDDCIYVKLLSVINWVLDNKYLVWRKINVFIYMFYTWGSV